MELVIPAHSLKIAGLPAGFFQERILNKTENWSQQIASIIINH
jgi:hypothetical protein